MAVGDALVSNLSYIVAVEDAVRNKWGRSDNELLALIREIGILLFEQYAKQNLDLSRLAWAQYDQTNLRILMQAEVPAVPEALIELLRTGRWIDKWLIERVSDEREFQTLVANRAFIQANGARSFEAFRRQLSELCKNYNQTERSLKPKFEHDRIYSTEGSGSISLLGLTCTFMFTGESLSESTKLRFRFAGVGARKIDSEIEFEPKIIDGQIVWNAGESTETPESLAKYCISSLLDAVQEDVSIGHDRKTSLLGFEFHNILSFGTATKYLPLGPLNIFIGPNGSGKSNIIEIFGLLNALANGEELEYISNSGGINEWVWKGSKEKKKQPTATIRVPLKVGNSRETDHYQLEFGVGGSQFRIAKESITSAQENSNLTSTFFAREREEAQFAVGDIQTKVAPGKYDFRRSVLSQFTDPERHRQLWQFNQLFKSFRFYRNSGIGSESPLDHPQYADLPNDALSENFENLGVVLERILSDDETNKVFTSYLNDFYEDAREVLRITSGGRIEIFLREQTWRTPISRLSDGTVKWICLLAILLDPQPTGVVFIEEPEVGLHPDIIPTLAKLLKEASNRRQIVMTTHSDVLVDSFTDEPEFVVVCEKEEQGTKLRRLSSEFLREYVEEYRLGKMWRSGKLGGNRW